MKRSFSLAALILAGCDDGDAGLSSLLRLDDEPAGTNCPAGGTAIKSGVDRNGDGVLGGDEVGATAYVCDPEPAGDGTLLRVDDEPPGANCAEGGKAIHTGSDDDGNGTLDDAEIDATEYVCSAAGGGAALVESASEPPGANCAAGGVAISIGVDADGDGVLDENEIESTSYLCTIGLGGVLDGDYDIENSLDMALIAAVTEITGNLVIEQSSISNLDGLAQLTTIGKNLSIQNNADLADLDGLAALTTVGSGVALVANIALTDASGLGALTSVGDNSLYASYNGPLAALDLGALATAPFVYIESHQALTSIDLSALTTTTTLYIRDNIVLSDLDGLAALTSVEGDVFITGNTSLAHVDGLSALATIDGVLEVSTSDALANLDGLNAGIDGSLTDLGGYLQVAVNPALTVCAATDLAAELTSQGWTGSLMQFGNMACSGSCNGAVCE